MSQRAETLIYFHEHDPNFSKESIVRLISFVNNTELFQNPDEHADAIADIKTEISLVTINSPYAEVRAVVSNKDDPSTPAGTIRAWCIGLFFVILQSFVNQLFSVRQPTIRLQAPVIQLLSFPLGKAWEKWMPVGKFTLFGSEMLLNPGKFNQKEHMLISIMANVSTSLPHSRYIIFTSWLKKYFDLPFAADFGFQICLSVRSVSQFDTSLALIKTACHEPVRLWTRWIGATFPGVSIILHLASIPCHSRSQPKFTQR
jgi:hypothetical protein